MELDVAAGGGGAAAVTLEAAADAEAERARASLTAELCTELALEVWLQLGRTLPHLLLALSLSNLRATTRER